MDKILDQYTSEQLHFKKGIFTFFPPMIELVIVEGEKCKGSFRVDCSVNNHVEGSICANNIRMNYEPKVVISSTTEIFYEFNSKGMEENDVLEGEFLIVSNQGETIIPFKVTIKKFYIQSTLGEMKDLFHFTNLAKSNWLEAVELFYKKDFIQLLSGNAKQYFELYKGLVYAQGNQQNVDTFLVEVNKKQEITYTVKNLELAFESGIGMFEKKIPIIKNGWGFTMIQCSCQGIFLSLGKTSISYEDFSEDNYELPYYIDDSKLHSGINHGSITLRYGRNYKIIISVKIGGMIEQKILRKSMKEKKAILELLQCYIAFRTKKITSHKWINNSLKIIEYVIAQNDENYLARLFQVQLLITKERYNEAKWILDRVEQVLKEDGCTDAMECYFWYLKTLYQRDENLVSTVTIFIEEAYEKDSSNWKIAWMLLYIKEEYNDDTNRWNMLQHLSDRGCSSPIILLEAMQLINSDPTLITELTEFGLEALIFTMKHQSMKKSLFDHIIFLLSKMKHYEPRLYRFLVVCYEKYPDVELLQGICTILILGDQVGEEYFKWYQLGVKEGLRIIRLYDYYMLSIPLYYEGELPKSVMLYFAYNTNLEYDRTAFLYANIIKNEEKFPEIVMSFRKRIIIFLEEQLMNERINKELAYLYYIFRKEILINKEATMGLKTTIFQRSIKVLVDDIQYVVVIHKNSKGEIKYPIINEKTMISIYSKDYYIFLQHNNGNRYLSNLEYSEENYFSAEILMEIENLEKESFYGLDLFMCECAENKNYIKQNNVQYFARLIKEAQLKNSYKKEIQEELVKYYYEMDEIAELDTLLIALNPIGYSKKQRAIFIEYMVQRGMYEESFEWIREYGVEGVEIKTLFILTSRLLIRDSELESPELIACAYYCYMNKKYDEQILDYLISFYQGKVEALGEIWKAGQSFDVEVHMLSEKILMQMLFSSTFLPEKSEIYEAYCKQGAKITIKKAFLILIAYEYFINHNIITSSDLKEIEEMYYDKEEIGDICYFAFLKYYSEHLEELDDRKIQMIQLLVKEFLLDNKYLAFFLKFYKLVPILSSFMNLTSIEYQGSPNSQVAIRYLQKDFGILQEKVDEMTHIYGGIFTKHSLLFYGEKIQYTITEICEGMEEEVESKMITKNDTTRDEKESKFSILNDIVISQSHKDYTTLDKLMEEYIEKEYMIHEFFTFL